jgi:uncharacterized protein YjbI with pentapeptide repeats
VTLPLLNVQLPIVGFYVVIPWLLLLFYFNLLLHLTFLAQRLHRFNAVLAAFPEEATREEQRLRLFPFPFSAMLIGRPARWRLRLLLGLMIWTTVLLLPLGLLLWAQVRFLPYHDTAITWSHRVAVLADLALLWLFWPLMLMPGPGGAPPAQTITLWRAEQQAARRLARTRRIRWGTGLLCLTLVAVVFALGIAVLPEEGMEGRMVVIASHLPGGLVQTARADKHVFKLTFWLFEMPGAPFHRNLQLKEKVLVAGEPAAEVVAALRSTDATKRAQGLEKITGLILTNRDLRSANLSGTLFPKANLLGAQLQGANLWDAQFQWANLMGAQLQGASFGYAQLQGANLVQAQLQGANLMGAQLQGASLWRAQLQGADFGYAQLQGASLQDAQLEGANLAHAQLQGADFGLVARLEGANLAHAQLQGAYLQDAQLQGADLQDAQLQGADLLRANIGSANVRNANLTWSDLGGLVQSPLDKNTYEALEKRLTDRISNTSVRAATLKQLHDAVNRRTNLSAARANESSVLCDDLSLFRFCVSPTQIAGYADDHARFLVTLGCKDTDGAIARGIMLRYLPFRPIQVQLERLDKTNPLLIAFAKQVTTSLEKDCPGWAALPADVKDFLRTLAAWENPVPE